MSKGNIVFNWNPTNYDPCMSTGASSSRDVITPPPGLQKEGLKANMEAEVEFYVKIKGESPIQSCELNVNDAKKIGRDIKSMLMTGPPRTKSSEDRPTIS